jgi:RNase P/RNase MRP subunit p30
MKPTIIQENTFEKTRKAIRKAKPPIVFTSNNDELNRKILEKEKIDILLINLKARKDWQKQRNSGLDSPMAKAAKKNNVIIAINLDELINVSGKDKAKILARIQQNIKLCNKNKLKMTFLPFKDTYDLKALSLVLGMSTWMFKEFNSFN